MSLKTNIEIPITKPFMPPQEEYEQYLNIIWGNEYITNNGPLLQELEQKLKDYLDVSYLLFIANGTLALQIAIKALGLKDEIITTPFSYVATTSSIVWEGCEPVFVDIDPNTFNIDPNLIEDKITDKTTGIMTTHVFGNPSNIESIQKIANKHNLKIIYDAAHCFGTEYKGNSVFEYGDVSMASFHATKLFHTVEGGAVFAKDKKKIERMAYMRNFGHDGFGKFNGVGINGKNTEFHAAMGLCMLNHIDQVLEVRKKQGKRYEHLFEDASIKAQQKQPDSTYNYSYYPILFNKEEQTIKAIDMLEENGISPRRYFYPSLNKLSYVNGQCPIAEDISKRILCLPLYHELTEREQIKIAELILKIL